MHHECEVDVKARGDFYLRVLFGLAKPVCFVPGGGMRLWKGT